jgi:sugar lactone lactonase YvrE
VPCSFIFCFLSCLGSYVAETMQNRVLRFYQQPLGVYHGSVFYQFSGGVGPNALTLDDAGNLYVALYDIKGKKPLSRRMWSFGFFIFI